MGTQVRKLVVFLSAAVLALQLYFVRELLAALILITVVFGAFALVVAALNLAQHLYNRGYVRAESMLRGRLSNTPPRRLRSETAP